MLSLTYLSTASRPLDDEQLRALLATCRSKNRELGLTGMLLHATGHFIQTLEGEDAVVDRTFFGIQRDPRHRDVFVTLCEQIDERMFPGWSMGFQHITEEEAALLPGFDDYLDGNPGHSNRRLGRAEVFHVAFRDHMR